MKYNIARCSIKWCKNENKRYIIIFNHMQRFYYLICQSTWCQNASKLIYQKGEISFLWDIKTWSIASLISMHDAELVDYRNQVDLKIDPRLACFFQNTRCSILPPCSILPRLTIYVAQIKPTALENPHSYVIICVTYEFCKLIICIDMYWIHWFICLEGNFWPFMQPCKKNRKIGVLVASSCIVSDNFTAIWLVWTVFIFLQCGTKSDPDIAILCTLEFRSSANHPVLR